MAKKFSRDELLLTALALAGGAARPAFVETDGFAVFFARRSRLDTAVQSLAARDVLTASAGLKKISVCALKFLELSRKKRLNQPGLDVSDSVLTRPVPVLPGQDFAPAPKPKPPEPPPPPENPSKTHVMPHAHANHSSRKSHEHGSCNSLGIKKLHDHERQPAAGHDASRKNWDVGELSPRTTEQILADIRKLQPGITDGYFEQWRSRIELEDAELVNGIVREAYLQRRRIKNIGGWMNACYLRGVGAKKAAPSAFAEMKEAAK